MVTYENGGPQYKVEEPCLAPWHKDKAVKLLEDEGYDALVDYFTGEEGGKEQVRPDGGRQESGIYAHIDTEGFVFASYDTDFAIIQDLEPPEDTAFSTLEYVEAEFLNSEHSDELIDQLTKEGDRVDDPPQVGELQYNENQVHQVEIDIPGYTEVEV